MRCCLRRCRCMAEGTVAAIQAALALSPEEKSTRRWWKTPCEALQICTAELLQLVKPRCVASHSGDAQGVCVFNVFVVYYQIKNVSNGKRSTGFSRARFSARRPLLKILMPIFHTLVAELFRLLWRVARTSPVSPALFVHVGTFTQAPQL